MKRIKGVTPKGVANIINNYSFKWDVPIHSIYTNDMNVRNGLKNPNATLLITVSADNWDYWGDHRGADILRMFIPIYIKKSPLWDGTSSIIFSLDKTKSRFVNLLFDKISNDKLKFSFSIKFVNLPNWATCLNGL